MVTISDGSIVGCLLVATNRNTNTVLSIHVYYLIVPHTLRLEM